MALSSTTTTTAMMAILLITLSSSSSSLVVHAKLADRSRLVQHRAETGKIVGYHDNGRPLEGHAYRSRRLNRNNNDDDLVRLEQQQQQQQPNDNVQRPPDRRFQANSKEPSRTIQKATKSGMRLPAPWKRGGGAPLPAAVESEPLVTIGRNTTVSLEFFDAVAAKYHATVSSSRNERLLSSQLSGCCYNYKSYSASKLCAMYGNDCESGKSKSHDSGDGDCSQSGLSFIGLSFSVNTASGNPYSYQLCDQFPMENIIDRDYEYVMSMDEDGWLVGGGYKTFDYSGKMPYVLVPCGV
jgi:hypothetical protein